MWLCLLSYALGILPPPVREIQIDFGHTSNPSAALFVGWNDVTVSNQGVPILLLDDSGAPTGVTLSFSGAGFGRAETGGVQMPAPGSALAQLGWPSSATSDALYSGATPVTSEVVLTLSGLDPAATFDLTLLASVLGDPADPEELATLYSVTGADSSSVVLEPRDNSAFVARLRGLRPDQNAELTLVTRAARTNTRPTRDFYLGALRLTEHAPGAQPPALGFTSSLLPAARTQGEGVLDAALSTYTNDSSSPALDLSARDTATGTPPAWLTLPRTALARTPIALSLDPTLLPPGTHTATVTARAAGFSEATTLVSLTVRPAGGPPDVLYFGNSYLKPPAGSLPDWVELAAAEAGLPVPRSVHRVALAVNLAYHASDPAQVEAISRSLPLGEEWEFVVLQGASLEPTVSAGDPALFLSSAQQIVANVKGHSPLARACFLQTWARAATHPIYQGSSPTFASPLAMHAELEAGYAQAALATDASWGAGTARLCATGESAALWAFDPWIYGPDQKHPGPALASMGAMNLLSAMLGERACDLGLDFQQPGGFVTQLLATGIDEATWYQLAGIADRVAETSLRRRPGSSEELLLTTGTGAALDACALKRLGPGTTVSILLTSPNGTYHGAAVTLHADLFLPGQPPGSFGPNPELHFDPQTDWILSSSTALGPAGLSATLLIQPWMIGQTLLIQGVAQAPSAKTGGAITATDAHLIRTGQVPGLGPPTAGSVNGSTTLWP